MLYWFLPYNHTIMSPLIIMRSHNYVSPPSPSPYHFNCNMSWCVSFWVHLIWNFLGFLDLDICFLPHIRKVFIHFFFI